MPVALIPAASMNVNVTIQKVRRKLHRKAYQRVD